MGELQGPRRPRLNRLASEKILSVLTTIPVRALDTPRLIVPLLGINAHGAILGVFWAAKEPSLVGVELISEDGRTQTWPIPDLYKATNEEHAKQGVVFNAVYVWSGSELLPMLRGKCSLRLVGEGVDTNAMPLMVINQ